VSRAAINAFVARMRPAGREFETPAIDDGSELIPYQLKNLTAVRNTVPYPQRSYNTILIMLETVAKFCVHCIYAQINSCKKLA